MVQYLLTRVRVLLYAVVLAGKKKKKVLQIKCSICSYRSRFRFLRRKREQFPFLCFDRLPFGLVRFLLLWGFHLRGLFLRCWFIFDDLSGFLLRRQTRALRDDCATPRNLRAHKNCASHC